MPRLEGIIVSKKNWDKVNSLKYSGGSFFYEFFSQSHSLTRKKDKQYCGPFFQVIIQDSKREKNREEKCC